MNGREDDNRGDRERAMGEDLVHGLLVALADREQSAGARSSNSNDRALRGDFPMSLRGDRAPLRDDRAPNGGARARLARRFPLTASLSAAAMVALVALIVIPWVGPWVGPREASAAELVRNAQRSLASASTRTYSLRITRWGGPFARRMVAGQIVYHAGPPPTSEGSLEIGDTGRRVKFGRDADGPWIVLGDGVRRTRLLGRVLESNDESPFSAHDVEAMTLDLVLTRLAHGYDLESLGSPTMRTVVAKRRDADGVGPSRVELELARDGRTIERATVELDRTAVPTTIEMRMVAGSE